MGGTTEDGAAGGLPPGYDVDGERRTIGLLKIQPPDGPLLATYDPASGATVFRWAEVERWAAGGDAGTFVARCLLAARDTGRAQGRQAAEAEAVDEAVGGGSGGEVAVDAAAVGAAATPKGKA
jgi:hypothetical protein